MVSVTRTGLPPVSPRATFDGSTRVVARTAPGMSSMPAPCRWTLSSRPRPGLPHHTAGSALLRSSVATVPGSAPGGGPRPGPAPHRRGVLSAAPESEVLDVQHIRTFLEQYPNVKYIFTGGKGGVGKTVCAAVLAYEFARRGQKTLIASLNPVHSLSSVFDQNLSGGQVQPVAGVDNLYAVEVDASDVVARYRENIAVRVREFLRYADIPVDAKPFIDIAVTNPAFEESAMFDKMVDIMLTEGPNYDKLIFDTAAVANAVRLIGLSKI